MTCEKCKKDFEGDTFVGYCPTCVSAYRDLQNQIGRVKNIRLGDGRSIHLDGQFADPKECAKSVMNPITGTMVCGLCGSDELESGYGFAGGFGLGVYNYCGGCRSIIDFVEDSDE